MPVLQHHNFLPARVSKPLNQGGIVVLVMVVMIVFIAITTYTLRFIIRQSHETINQAQEEQAFTAADSGVSYALWLLNPAGGHKSPGEIATLPTITNHPVKDESGQIISTFTLDNIIPQSQAIQFRSVGRDIVLTDKCQVIAVQLRQMTTENPYLIIKWDHQVGYPCP